MSVAFDRSHEGSDVINEILWWRHAVKVLVAAGAGCRHARALGATRVQVLSTVPFAGALVNLAEQHWPRAASFGALLTQVPDFVCVVARAPIGAIVQTGTYPWSS